MLEILWFLSALPCVASLMGWLYTGGIGWLLAAAALIVPHIMVGGEVLENER